MRSIARRTAVGAALLLIMPVAVWISGWRWQPGDQSWLLKAAFGSLKPSLSPRASLRILFYSAGFSGVCVFASKPQLCYLLFWQRQFLSDRELNPRIKGKVQEPRPFVIWLEKTHHIPVDEFYTLKRADRGNLVKEQLAEEKISRNIYVLIGRKRRGLPFLPATRCLPPVSLARRWAVVAT